MVHFMHGQILIQSLSNINVQPGCGIHTRSRLCVSLTIHVKVCWPLGYSLYLMKDQDGGTGAALSLQ